MVTWGEGGIHKYNIFSFFTFKYRACELLLGCHFLPGDIGGEGRYPVINVDIGGGKIAIYSFVSGKIFSDTTRLQI